MQAMLRKIMSLYLNHSLTNNVSPKAADASAFKYYGSGYGEAAVKLEQEDDEDMPRIKKEPGLEEEIAVNSYNEETSEDDFEPPTGNFKIQSSVDPIMEAKEDHDMEL